MYTPRQNARILLSAGKIRQQNVFYKEIITMRILVTDGMDKTAMAELREMGHEVVEQFYEPDQLG